MDFTDTITGTNAGSVKLVKLVFEACHVSNTVCGDGIQGCSEECDDNNHNSGDGCGKHCKKDCGWVCPYENRLCVKDTCGNDSTEANLGEECDDGNNEEGDGCTYDCKNENS